MKLHQGGRLDESSQKNLAELLFSESGPRTPRCRRGSGGCQHGTIPDWLCDRSGNLDWAVWLLGRRTLMSHDEQTPMDVQSVRERARHRLGGSTSPGEHLIAAAWLASLGDFEAYRSWPSRIPAEEAATIPDWLSSSCRMLILRLRKESGRNLADALLRAQELVCLMYVDQEHGALLEAQYESIAGVLLECARLPLDDVAALGLEEHIDLQFLNRDHVIPIVAYPLGTTACSALASMAQQDSVNDVQPVCPVPTFEEELVFDSGRPSDRMMDRFAERRGALHCRDGSSSEVRAVLEEDWRISVQFTASDTWCEKIDRVRIGTRVAECIDDHRDFWIASLGELSLDAQTRLINQPILVTLVTGERFSL